MTSAPTLVDAVVRTSGNDGQIRAGITGVILDLDGVLADTETQFFRAVNEILAREGLTALRDAEAVRLVGLDNETLWTRLCEIRPLRLALGEYTSWVDAVAQDLYARDLAPAEGAIELLARIRTEHLPLGLATSAEAAWVDNRLGVLGLTGAFDVIVTGDTVRHTKPHPEIYLTAAANLGVTPGDVLAVEDSPTGISSAKAAGVFVAALRTRWSKHMDLSAADAVVDSLHDIAFDRPIAGRTELAAG